MSSVRRDFCISCGQPLGESCVEIADQYPSALYLNENEELPDWAAPASLDLVMCSNPQCSLVQLANKLSLKEVFSRYPYVSGSTASMKEILQGVVDSAVSKVSLSEDDVVLDIGGNDGTLLGLVKENVRRRVNIDGSNIVRKPGLVNYTHVNSLFSAESYNNLDLPKPKLIFSVAMFYHLENPVQFCRDVRSIMDDKTLWVIQLTYLGAMLENNMFDNIVHEHVGHYSLKSLEFLLNRFGLKVAFAENVKSYGGSLRVGVVIDSSEFDAPEIHKTFEYFAIKGREFIDRVNEVDTLKVFGGKSAVLAQSLKSVLGHLRKQGKTVWGLGASTKGNMLLQYCGLGPHEVQCILDNNAFKIGKKTIGTGVLIVDERIALQKMPDYFLILPYFYTEVFIELVQQYLRPDQSVYFILPVPKITFIKITKDLAVWHE